MTKYMVFDQDRCFGCNACVVACQQEYGLPAAVKFNRVDVQVSGNYPNTAIVFKPLVCNQCDTNGGKAPCQVICPVGAISRDNGTGVIVTDSNKCVGCRLCTTATGCPYGMRTINGSGKSVKCNFCIDRGDTDPYCVKTCPTRARKMVEVPLSGDANPTIGKVYYKAIANDGTIS